MRWSVSAKENLAVAHFVDDEICFFSSRRERLSIANQLDTEEQTTAANITDYLVTLLQFV